MTRRSIAVVSLLVAIAAGVAAGWMLSDVRGGGSPAERYAYQAANSKELPHLWQVPAFALTDQRGAALSSADLVGHVWVADFVFTTCKTLCPMLTAKFVRVQRQLTDASVRFVSFSVDPKNDTQEALAAYHAQWAANEGRWLLGRTTPDSLETIAKGMRVAVEAQDDVQDPIIHSAMFFLVDAQGSVRGVYDSGDEAALTRLLADAAELLHAPAKVEGVNAASGPSQAGAELYRIYNCGACHGNPALAPNLAGLAGTTVRLQNGTEVLADRAYLKESILSPGVKQVAGYPNIMPTYGTEIDEAKVERLVDYIESLRAAPPAPSMSAPGTAASTTLGMPSALGPATPGGPAPAGAAPGSNAPVTAPAPASLEKDPVCGMDVRVDATTPQATHAGHSYHFCSPGCREQFMKDPSRYTKAR